MFKENPIEKIIEYCQDKPDGSIIYLKQFTPFVWDEMFVIHSGYIPEGTDKKIGLIEGDLGSGKEGTEIIIFLYKKKLVVQYSFKRLYELHFETKMESINSAVFRIERPYTEKVIFLAPLSDEEAKSVLENSQKISSYKSKLTKEEEEKAWQAYLKKKGRI